MCYFNNFPQVQGTVTKKRVPDSTTNLKHLMDLHRVQFLAKLESNHNPDLHSDTIDAYTKSTSVIAFTFHLQNTPRAQASSSPSMFIRNLTTTQPKIVFQKQTAQAIYPCTFLCISHLPNFTCQQHRPLIST
jgi:hypothetical protein